MERPVLEDTGSALITRFGDRGRDRHARENMFKAYDHYLDHYWDHRTISAEIIDTVPYGGNTITFNVTTEYKLSDNEAELRFFYRGIGTVAEYHNNGVMTPIDDLHYTRTVTRNAATGGNLQVGDHMEFELSQFLDASVEDIGEPGAIGGYRGRANYYGTTYLYIVGEGLVPWQADNGEDENRSAPYDTEFSYPIGEEGWLGGLTTLPYQYTDEPRDHFMQMANNLAGDNAQPFVHGRRVVHTDFDDGHHTERRYPEEPNGVTIVDNPLWSEQIGKLGPHYINNSCDDCHEQNSRALPADVGETLDKWVFKVGDAEGNPLPDVGAVLQVGTQLGQAEGNVTLGPWIEEDGLRRPTYNFSGVTPTYYSARIAPQLVGMGLLEAIPESAIIAMADPGDSDGDGISGRYRTVADPGSGVIRLGRFGYKSGQATVKNQSAAALNTDMGVMTSIFPDADCGSAQSGCESGAELSDENLDNLALYISLLGVRAQRSLDSPNVSRGRALFSETGCSDCHTPTLQTSAYARHAELRDQTIHPYTDMLLHDMGAGLADNLPEGQATGAEWRTAPLWGIGLTSDVNAGEAYLHDGRARTLEEAIRWHGGEGEAAKDDYEALSAADKAAVIAFLRSL